MEVQKVEKEEVDISRHSGDPGVYSPGSLAEIDERKRIDNHWMKERAIVYLSVTVIIAILATAVGMLVLSGDEPSREWGRQIVATLLGFAAGAIWQADKGKR